MTRSAVACALAAVAIAVAGAGCGGTSSADRAADAAAQRAELRWRADMTRWRTDMVNVLNAISLMFADARSVDLLQRGDERTNARLQTLEARLGDCSVVVRRLGPAPEDLVTARRLALRACDNLERGARLVQAGVEQWQNGRGMDKIDDGTVLLGVGQDGLARTRAELQREAVSSEGESS